MPITKKDLNALKISLGKKIRENSVRISKLWIETTEIKEDISLLRKDLVGMKDEIVGEIKAMREEFGAHQSGHVRQQDILDGHEERIDNGNYPLDTRTII